MTHKKKAARANGTASELLSHGDFNTHTNHGGAA